MAVFVPLGMLDPPVAIAATAVVVACIPTVRPIAVTMVIEPDVAHLIVSSCSTGHHHRLYSNVLGHYRRCGRLVCCFHNPMIEKKTEIGELIFEYFF